MNNDLIVLEGVRRVPMRYTSSPFRQDIQLSGIKSKLKKAKKKATAAVKTVTAPVVAVTQPIVQAVQNAAPIVQPIVAPIVEQAKAQVERAQTIAAEYGTQQLQELKDRAIAAAKDPAIQNAAIMAAATAIGAPEVGAQIAQANTTMQNTYDEYNQQIRAIQALNSNPNSQNAARIASQSNPETATLLRAYSQELDQRATGAALQSAGLPQDTGLSTMNPWIIGGILGGGALLVLLATQKKR